jgi:hypothetical protein
METVNRKTFWDLIENPPANVVEVNELIHWSMNYDIKTGTPYHLFLDLIGYSFDNYGERLYKGEPRAVLGFMEMDIIGKALIEYSSNPQAVENWIEALMDAETYEAEANK